MMDSKELKNVGETVVKKKQKRSPRPNQQPQTEPGDNRKYLRHTLQVAKLEKIDMKNPEQVSNRVMEYFDICDENDMKPSVAGLALGLGIDRRYLWEIRTGQKKGYPSEVVDTLKRAVTTINSMMEDYMQNGKINPVSGIFLMKNNMDYSDKQEVVVTPNQPLGTAESPEKLEERYRESVVIDTDGQEVED